MLDATSTIEALTILRDNIDNIKKKVPVIESDHEAYINRLVNHYNQLIIMAKQPTIELKDRIKIINDQLDIITHQLFANNYELEERPGNVEYIRASKVINVTVDTEQLIKQRIFLHTNWRYPALEIGCRDGDWTQFMVAGDPLYIIDRHQEFLDSTVNQFTPEYQRRIRPYQLVNHNLSKLPQEQFGFVFSWGYFNFVSMDTMKQYLRQIFNLLRPGGIFMFSYNDGDTPAGAGMAEGFSQTYMPKSLLSVLAESLGFEIHQSFHPETNISWIELKRPGTLQTIKAHQVMGEIKYITH